MMILVIGKSGSGKSEYAENLLLEMAKSKEKYYIATMRIMDKAGEERVKRHRIKRQGKGFITIEQPENIGILADKLPEDSAVLLECVTNLTANEMFDKNKMSKEAVINKVMDDIRLLQNKIKTFVVVTGTYSDTNDCYDEETKTYISALSAINDAVARLSDRVVYVEGGVSSVKKGMNV